MVEVADDVHDPVDCASKDVQVVLFLSPVLDGLTRAFFLGMTAVEDRGREIVDVVPVAGSLLS